MKKNLILMLVLFISTQITSQNYYTATPEGFGASATGGGNVAPVVVTTYADLKAKIKLATPQVIVVSGTITIPSGQSISEVVKDKTILGLPGARLVNNTQTQSGSGILNLKNGSSNVIIRNLIFEGPGAYDVDGRDNLTADGCLDLWVDHCEFQDGVDGNFDIKGNSDRVTVSWCKFTYLKPSVPGGPGGSNDHRFSNLVGSSSSDAPADGHFSVTFQNCHWAQGCKARMPRARNAQLHIINCYYNPSVSSSAALGLGGGINNTTCLVENSHFANVTHVYQNAGSDGGTVALRFQNCINGVNNIGTVNTPIYDYTVYSANQVAEVVTDETCGAGATLQVTENGVVSSTCENLNHEEFAINNIKLYPTVAENAITVEFPNEIILSVHTTIFNISGQNIWSTEIGPSENKRFEIPIKSLEKGTYILQTRTKNRISNLRFVKK
jgi:pectate lyase